MTKARGAGLQPARLETSRRGSRQAALAVFELIDDLRDQIGSPYRLAIEDERRRQLEPNHDGDDASAPQHAIWKPETRFAMVTLVPRHLAPPAAGSRRI